MSASELFLIAMLIIFALPFLVWRILGMDDLAPLVVVQILTGVALGPGALGALYPQQFDAVFRPPVVQALNGVAWWAVMLFVWIAGMELDLRQSWAHRRESLLTAGLALGVPMLSGAVVAACALTQPGWIGARAQSWQFIAGLGMACAVTALPILVLFLEKLAILRRPLGQRILRYASLDDIAIWAVLALILTDWERVGRQITFLLGFALLSAAYRGLMPRLPTARDRWGSGLIWLLLTGFAADWSGLHFMVGAFLAGAVTDGHWFDQDEIDRMRSHVLLLFMPVFFLSTGLRTHWNMGGTAVVLLAASLLVAAVLGKHVGIALAGWRLGWSRAESRLIAWLLQTKALIMIIFVNVLLDRGIISDNAFTALLLMAVASTVLSIPMSRPWLRDLSDHPDMRRD